VQNVLVDLQMLPGELKRAEEALLCSRSYWLYSDTGGVLEVFPQLRHRVRAGERIARVSSIFGDVVREYQAPEDGVVVGKNVSPVNRTGARLLHLGVVGTPEGAATPLSRLADRDVARRRPGRPA
jgi:predicted deacylase